MLLPPYLHLDINLRIVIQFQYHVQDSLFLPFVPSSQEWVDQSDRFDVLQRDSQRIAEELFPDFLVGKEFLGRKVRFQ